MTDDLASRMRLRRKRAMLDAAASELPATPAASKTRRVRKKVYKKSVAPRSDDDDETSAATGVPDATRVGTEPSGAREGVVPLRVAVEHAERPDAPREDLSPHPSRMVAPCSRRRDDERNGLNARERAEPAKGFYSCPSCRCIAYAGFGWRKPPPCPACGHQTTRTTRGHCEDNQSRIVSI